MLTHTHTHAHAGVTETISHHHWKTALTSNLSNVIGPCESVKSQQTKEHIKRASERKRHMNTKPKVVAISWYSRLSNRHQSKMHRRVDRENVTKYIYKKTAVYLLLLVQLSIFDCWPSTHQALSACVNQFRSKFVSRQKRTNVQTLACDGISNDGGKRIE